MTAKVNQQRRGALRWRHYHAQACGTAQLPAGLHHAVELPWSRNQTLSKRDFCKALAAYGLVLAACGARQYACTIKVNKSPVLTNGRQVQTL